MKNTFQSSYRGWYIRGNSPFGINVAKDKYSIERFIEDLTTNSITEVSRRHESTNKRTVDDYLSSIFLINSCGWGMKVNERDLVAFGFYKNGSLVHDLTPFVRWFQSYMNFFEYMPAYKIVGFKKEKTNELIELFIGLFDSFPSYRNAPHMGFRFMSDGSVWVGYISNWDNLTGIYIHFSNTGEIYSGLFVNGVLTQRMTLQEIISVYFSTFDKRFHQYLPFIPLAVKKEKLHDFSEVGKSFLDIITEEIQVGKKYFL